MWNEPSLDELKKLPKLYETEDQPLSAKIVHEHFFLAGCDWWICEFDGEDLFFGYAVLNGDEQNGEWGYVSFRELKELRLPHGFEVDRDLHWQPKTAGDIPQIKTYEKE